MGPGQAALKIDRIGRLEGAVCAQFYGRTGNECTGRHDDLAVIARHIPGFGTHEAVHRRGRLDPLAEGNQAFRLSEGDRLDNVMPALLPIRDYAEAQTFINIGGKNGPLQGACRNRRGKEQSLDRKSVV